MTTSIIEDGKLKKRGRKPLDNNFEFPKGEFRIRELANQYKVSLPYIHLKIKAAGDKVRLVRKETTGKKGKPAGVYEYTGYHHDVISEAVSCAG